MSRAAKAAVVLGISLMFLAMAVTPFSLMLLPNPEPMSVRTAGEAGRGTYVADDRGVFKLFPRAALARQFPADAYETRPGAAVCVKARQFDNMSAYGFYRFGEARQLPARKEILPERVLRVTPARPLEPGHYVVRVSRDDMWGGTDYFYLDVK